MLFLPPVSGVWSDTGCSVAALGCRAGDLHSRLPIAFMFNVLDYLIAPSLLFWSVWWGLPSYWAKVTYFVHVLGLLFDSYPLFYLNYDSLVYPFLHARKGKKNYAGSVRLG